MIQLQPSINNFNEYLQLAKVHNFSFEIMDLAYPAILDNDEQLKKVINLYQNTPNYSAHGVFIDINYSGGDSLILEATKKRLHSCFKSIKKLQIKRIILHSCFFPIMPENSMLYDLWCEDSAKLLIDFAVQYDTEILIENVLDISPFVIRKLMEKANHKKINVCLDIGHANLTKTPISGWFEVLHPYIKYMHLSDNNGVFDEHLALGDGNIDFAYMCQLLEKYKIKSDYTLEVTGIDRVIKSIEYLKRLDYVK